MENSRRNLYAILIAGVSFLLVIGAILTALAETGFSFPASRPPTETLVQISTATSITIARTMTPVSDEPTSTLTNSPTPSVFAEESQTPTGLTTSSPTTTFNTTETMPVQCTTPTSGSTYKVQSGDTLFSIAVRFQSTVSTLQAGNCLGGSTRIVTGSTIWVPNNPTITPTKTKVPTATKIVCYKLTLSHSGDGSNPTSSPSKSAGCSAGMYVEGEQITLTAAPAAGWTVGSWSGTDDDTSTSKTNILTMPDKSQTVNVTYLAPTCYPLTLSVSGTGAELTADPENSPGCTVGSYVEGEIITLTAAPGTGWAVSGWTGTNNNASTAVTNTVTMPASNHAAAVTYQAICYTLTLTHTGSGSDPTANPTNSASCPIGSFIFGESISLNAAPDTGWKVDRWSGTDDDISTDLTNNTWTMQDSNHTIEVTYIIE